MKIIHLTDTHLLGVERANLYGINPAYLLKKAIKSIKKHHEDAIFVAITGDLVACGNEEAYLILKDEMSKLNIPIYLMLGNHDNRKNFSKLFPQYVHNDLVQYSIKIEKKVFFFLDTLVDGERYGKLCDVRLAWLKDNLAKYKKFPIYIFMHHHPVDSGLYEMDNIANFRSANEFWDILNEYDNVKHISFGHVHRIMHAVKDGVSMHSTRSTTFQVSYQPHNKLEYLTNKEKPTYAIMDIKEDNTLLIHHHEYLDEKRYYEDGSR